MLQKIFFFVAITCHLVSFAQEPETKRADVPFAVIENVPVYPGCTENTNEELKNCMSDKISAFVDLHFNMNKIAALNLPPKIYRTAVQFKIDKQGEVSDISVRADHPEIEKEAMRVVRNLPQMIPGKHRGKNVGVLYALPIIFKIEPPTKKKQKKKYKNKRKS
ncbi:energy transducer TonB [Aequorivita marina]|uniref:energy transducer TonB n=1 Tax=Aequorivita marina TaxID=3073654 RepID=UPI0028758FEA|nr:energy transducer TonB [Aequorivita sp. S2608]MDS1297148.1 energy transducer TonB [Aequorivita sp. S2608]